MSTSLYLITNTILPPQRADWQKIVDRLNALNIDNTFIMGANNELIKEEGDWHYNPQAKYPEVPFSVDFTGPFAIQPELYSNIGVIFTIYKYRLLYENYDLDWFGKFRQDLYQIVTAIGGTEVIYLADNACDKVSYYLMELAWDNVPYYEIKNRMIKEIGQPVTDYSKLDFKTLSYANINEFFLDDFSDLK